MTLQDKLNMLPLFEVKEDGLHDLKIYRAIHNLRAEWFVEYGKGGSFHRRQHANLQTAVEFMLHDLSETSVAFGHKYKAAAEA